jgi:putative ABC transport system ATP-binding protein
MANVLEMKNVSKKYGEKHTEVTALKDLSFAVKEGEFAAVIGPSGSGKSTFLTIAAGLQKPTDGDVRIGGPALERSIEKTTVETAIPENRLYFAKFQSSTVFDCRRSVSFN